MIDWENKDVLDIKMVNEIFKWTIKGVGRITGTPMPKVKQITIISYKAFSSADSDGSGAIDLSEFKNWIELNAHLVEFLEKYEPFANPFYDLNILEDFPKFDVDTLTD